MIYVSTGNYKDLTGEETINLFLKNGITNIELSGGKYFDKPYTKIEKYIEKANIQVHNYFPPPQEPFVLNFCSEDNDIIEKSKNLVKNNIEFTKKIKKKYVTFHAGFLIDLKFSDLGKSKNKFKILDKSKGMNNFLKNIKELSDFAEKNNVEILLENNVIGKSNYQLYNYNPFLMTSVNDICEIMNNTPDNVNFLLDVGHLKVSSNVLGFQKLEVFDKCKKWIKALHISENDGIEDTNEKITLDAWFNGHLPKADFYTLEVYSKDLKLIKEQISLLNKIIL